MGMPEHGLDREELRRRMQSFREHDLDAKSGRTWAYVYNTGRSDIDAIGKEAYVAFLSENGLDPTAFPSLLRMENEVVGIAAAHLGGDEHVAGSFTSGGTESILLAVKTARDYARARRPDIQAPEMVLPETAHAAFHKAAHYLGVEPVVVPVDPDTFKANAEAVERAITPRTCLLVGSAASYAHGVVDPIGDLGRVALRHDLLLHVDGCIGGFLLPYLRRLGEPIPEFDFKVPGVTSISMDFHKYAYTPKGASVVLYKTRELRRHQLYACASWPGYSVVNATIQSSKSGGPIAATWAVLHAMGDRGYLELARRTLEATRSIVAGIGAIPGLRVLGRPDMGLVPFTSDEIDVFRLIDELNSRGFYVQPQFAFGRHKENVHLTLTASSLEHVERFLSELRSAVDAVRSAPADPEVELFKSALDSVDVRELSSEQLTQMLAMAGITGGVLPAKMAGVSGLLNRMQPDVRERLLIEFFNSIFETMV